MAEDWIISEGQLTYLEQCGSGVDGEVYHVLLKTNDGHTVEAAAKRFKEHYKEWELDSQKKELDFLRKLKHPNIVQFFCAVLYPITIIVTEFAAKGSLYEYLKKRTRLPKGHMLEWARQASSAVEYLQQNNVVHRDIKSSNFVVTSDDMLKLCDFGIAKKQCKTEKTNQERGTISWMAPEAFVEKVSSKASDIYSLGIVIWELISCKIPYQGRESLSILYAVKVHKLRPDIPDHCPHALKHLLEKSWKENRKRRPDIKEVLDTIETLIHKHQLEQSRVEFSEGRKEIYTLYQKHLALENKQNALNEVVTIPIDNGMPDADCLSAKTVDTTMTDFDHIDMDERVSFITHIKRSYGRCLRYILAFALCSFAVIGVAALVWHLLGGPGHMPGCKPPKIKHASRPFKCEVGPQSWACVVSCNDGYSWTGDDNNVIVCEAPQSMWNISTYHCEGDSSKSMISYGSGGGSDEDILPVTHQSTGKLNSGQNHGTMGKDDHDASRPDYRSHSPTPRPLHEADARHSPTPHMSSDQDHWTQNSDERRPHDGPESHPKEGLSDHQSSTKLPTQRVPPTTMPTTIEGPITKSAELDNQTASAVHAPLYQESAQETSYSLILSDTANLDNSLNATIKRTGDTFQTPGKVDICMANNCTEVYFSPDTKEIGIRFFIGGPSNSLSRQTHMQMVQLQYSVNNSTTKIKSPLPEDQFPSDMKVVFNMLMGGA